VWKYIRSFLIFNVENIIEMENIIVGIDFSKGSECAIELSVDIANRMSLDLKMVYVSSTSQESGNSSEAEVQTKIEELVKKYQPCLTSTVMSYEITEGKVSQELARIAKQDEAVMVVVGTHGTSGYEKDWIGRNAYKTIEDTECPVLTIRENFDFNKELENIVLPIDSSMDTRQKVPFTIKMAKLFNSKIHILGLYSSESIMPMVDKYVDQVEKFVKSYNIEYTVEKTGSENITNSTLEYAEKMNADLIVIMTEQEKKLTNIVLGSYAQQMIHHSMIPVLTIHPEEINSTAR
jgi:nucleotide-binding universal stress UspA family protein